MINDTHRTFPRTLKEAFPNTTEYGAAIEVPAPTHPHDRIVLWSSAIAVVALVILTRLEIL